MAELADARDLKSLDPDTGRAGSTPAPGTYVRRLTRRADRRRLTANHLPLLPTANWDMTLGADAPHWRLAAIGRAQSEI